AMTVAMPSVTTYEMTRAMAASRQTEEEREYELVQRNWPVRVLELVEVKNLQSASFPDDFEVVVKNVGSKPIYGIYFALIFKRPGILWHLLYGDEKFRDKSKLAVSTDMPINVGETGSLKLCAEQVKVFKLCIEKGAFTDFDTKKLLIHPRIVNFGDETGYELNYPYPAKREDKWGKDQLSGSTSRCSCGNTLETLPRM
ncbi:MAG TPA: hypothetical protein PLK30_25280, partial [Blastocatellia bacterium]|nr:hypothetical protein [Blastocatellia bacterium]